MGKINFIALFLLFSSFSAAALSSYELRMNNDVIRKEIQELKEQNERNNNTVNMLIKHSSYLSGEFSKVNNKISLNTAAITPKNFRWSRVKNVRSAVRKTIEDYDLKMYMSTKQLTEYASTVIDYCDLYDVPVSLVLAMTRKESAFNPLAVSIANAKGMIQIIPETAEQIAAEIGKRHYNMFKIADNVRFGIYYISSLLDRYDRDFRTALQGYNCGPTCVNRVKSGIYSKFPDETETYTRMILDECLKYKEDGTCSMKGFIKYYEDMGI